MTPVSEPGPAQQRAFATVWHDPTGVVGALRTIQNIPLSRRYMVAAFAFFLAAGVQALLLRVQLLRPDNDFLDAATYNQLFTMHGTTMMFLFVIPFLEALAAYILPLMLGTRDLPFPRMTALSFWTYVFGGLFLYSSFLVGAVPDGGWFAYLPLTGKRYSPGLGIDFWDIGLSVAEIAAMGAAAELIVGVLRMRAPGMSLARLPLFAWAMLVTGVMIIFAFTPLIVGTAMLELDRKLLTRFFDPSAGGEPLLWQHLFWVFGHPEVYIMFVPAVGIVSQIVQTFARRPLVGHTLMVLALVATGFVSFGLWVHHMFTTGLAPLALAFFSAATMMIAVPNGIQVFGWLTTLAAGRPRWAPPLLFVAGFITIFVVGGLTGVMLAAIPFNWQAHDSYFVVGHFHYVLIGGVVFPMFAGLYYWLPKITGRRLHDRLGRWNFWLMFVFFNVTFFPMHLTGLAGMPRRIYTYGEGMGWTGYNAISTIGAFGFAAAVLLLVVNVLWSLYAGPPAGPNPWGGDTLEWTETSPPAEAQYPELPVVRSRHPVWQQSAFAPEDGELTRTLAPLHVAPTGWRGGLVVSALEGRPLAIVHLPGPTLVPFVASVGFVGLLAAALIDSLWLALLGALVTAGALVGWFWPRTSERRAIEELGEARPGQLPLAVAGPTANGWWATCVFLLVLATALVTLVASYFYLGGATRDGPRVAPPLAAPLAATALLLGAWGATVWTESTIGSVWIARRRLALAATSGLAGAFVALTCLSYRAMGIPSHQSAYGSILLGLFGFQWIVMLLLIVMLGLAQLWAWLSPGDPRGHAVVMNASLVSHFALVSWLVVAATLYLTPRLG